MASIGLALVQGQKNAQDLATSQMSTFANMAKSAKDFSDSMEYFDPVAEDTRKRVKEEQALSNTKMREWNNLAQNVYADPTGVGATLMSKMDGGFGTRWEIDPVMKDGSHTGEYVARKIQGDAKGGDSIVKEVPFASKNDLISTLGMQYTQTPADALKTITALRGKEVEHGEKRSDMLTQAQVKWLYGGQQEDATKRYVAGTEANARLGSAKMMADANVQDALIGLRDKGKDRHDMAVLALRAKGFGLDKDGNPISYRGKDMSAMSDDEAAAVYNNAAELISNVAQSGAVGLPAGASPEAVKRRLSGSGMSAREASEARARGLRAEAYTPPQRTASPDGTVVGGIPSKQALDYAAKRKAQRLAAQQQSKEAQDREDFYRMQRENDPSYKPRFY